MCGCRNVSPPVTPRSVKPNSFACRPISSIADTAAVMDISKDRVSQLIG